MMSPQSITTRTHLLCLATLLSIVLTLLTAPTPTYGGPLLPGELVVERRRYCSNNLNEIIELICGGRYYSLSRKFPQSVGADSRRSSIHKRFAPDEGVFYRPLQTGPIHECCRRPCGYSELKLYCAPD